MLNPAEWDATRPPRRLELQGDDLLRACAALQQTSTERSRESALGSFLDAVAKDLNRVGWRNLPPVADGFLVHATDTENADVERHLRAAVPTERLGPLDNAGLVAE